MPKLLIITHSYPPSNAPAAQRTFFFAKYLNETSHIDVEIVTPGTIITGSGTSDWADKHEVDSIVHRTKYMPLAGTGFRAAKGFDTKLKPGFASTSKRNLLAGLKQKLFQSVLVPDRGVVWYPYAIRKAAKVIRRDASFCCVLSSSPSFSDHLVAARLKKKFAIPWIADIRDFHWIEGKEFSVNGRLGERHKKVEQLVMNEADACTFISESMLDEYVLRYPEINKRAFAIYNGYDPFEFPEPALTSAKKFTIFYSGSFYGGLRSPRPLLQSLDQLIRQGIVSLLDVEIQIAGSIDNVSKQILSEYECSKAIRFLGIVTRNEVFRRMSEADLLWLIVGNSKSHHHGFPVKGYEYIGAKRPILAFCPDGSESQRVLHENHVDCTFTDASSTSEIKNYLLQFISRKCSFEKISIGKDTTSPRFTRRFQAEQLGEIIKQVASLNLGK